MPISWEIAQKLPKPLRTEPHVDGRVTVYLTGGASVTFGSLQEWAESTIDYRAWLAEIWARDVLSRIFGRAAG